jgi:hypothetical protein
LRRLNTAIQVCEKLSVAVRSDGFRHGLDHLPLSIT